MRGDCRVGSVLGNPEGYVNEGSGNGQLSPHVSRWETWKLAHLEPSLSERQRMAVEKKRPSFWELCDWNLRRGFLYFPSSKDL